MRKRLLTAWRWVCVEVYARFMLLLTSGKCESFYPGFCSGRCQSLADPWQIAWIRHALFRGFTPIFFNAYNLLSWYPLTLAHNHAVWTHIYEPQVRREIANHSNLILQYIWFCDTFHITPYYITRFNALAFHSLVLLPWRRGLPFSSYSRYVQIFPIPQMSPPFVLHSTYVRFPAPRYLC